MTIIADAAEQNSNSTVPKPLLLVWSGHKTSMKQKSMYRLDHSEEGSNRHRHPRLRARDFP